MHVNRYTTRIPIPRSAGFMNVHDFTIIGDSGAILWAGHGFVYLENREDAISLAQRQLKAGISYPGGRLN